MKIRRFAILSRLMFLGVLGVFLTGCSVPVNVPDNVPVNESVNKSFFDSFSTAGYLDSGYRFFDEGSSDSYAVSGGRLEITSSRRQDLWGGIPIKRGAPIMLRSAPTVDYDVESDLDAKWSGTPQRINTQVGLFVFQDVENWLFFGFTMHASQGGSLPNGNGLIVTSTIGDSSKIRHYQDYGPDSGTLKIERRGDYWRFYIGASTIAQIHAVFSVHEVGMGVKSFDSGGTAQKGNFYDFRISIVD